MFPPAGPSALGPLLLAGRSQSMVPGLRPSSGKAGGQEGEGGEGARPRRAGPSVVRCAWRAPDSSSFSGSCPPFPLKRLQACLWWGPGASPGAHCQHPCPSSRADLKVGEAVAEPLLILGEENSGSLWERGWPGGLATRQEG